MGFNVKNDQAHRLAKKLAELTGETMTAAVTEALRERLARVQHATDGKLAARLLAIGKKTAAHMKEPFRSTGHADLLYDERGLPR